MKKLSFNLLAGTLLLCATAFSFSSCDNDDKNDTPLVGSYTGKMINSDVKDTINVSASATNTVITTNKFPMKAIVASVAEQSKVDSIVKAIGNVTYEINYTGTTDAKNTSVSLLLVPDTYKGTIGSKKLEVTFKADQKGTYTISTKKLEFEFEASAVSFDGKPITTFKGLTYKAELTKK